ncbi:7TM diverse intracellular signaling domain-containing protein [Psychroserpens sp.]|uniref:hybrid sensor histidine kinase/response regulator n=2 Tax=Psychroserpens sp. TaxID=2020870 RepID=UPI003C723A0E
MKQLLLITYLLAYALHAQKPIFDPEKSSGELYQYAEFTNVGIANYSIDDILNNSLLEYEELNSENHDFGFTSDAYWIRFKLKNSSNSSLRYYLETARPITDIVNLYHVGKTIRTQKNGDQIPFDKRTVAHRQIVFEIALEANSEQEFYINLVSDGETTNLPLNLYTPSAFLNSNTRQQLFLGLFYGVLLLAGLIYLFFYTSLKSKAFLYYGLYVFSIALMQASLDGLAHQYFFPDGGYLNSRMVLISALFSNFFLLKYCEYFLRVKVLLSGYQKFYNGIYCILAILFVLLFISPKTLELVYPISNFNGLLSLILILSTVFTLRMRKIAIDTYFSIGIFFLVIGLLGFVMNNLGILPSNFYTLNSSKFGTGLEVVFLSLSMTNLLRTLREEKDKSQLIALKKSEEVGELKTFFMSNMSHELRTPINAIMGIVETELADRQQTTEGKEKYQVIRNATLSLLSNVNDILDFDKIGKNEIQLKDEAFNPKLIIEQISENWNVEARKKGLEYRFEMDTEIPELVSGDADRLLQIINNVLSNAVKFTATGSILFKLKCLDQPDRRCQFSFQVSDTGIGMDKHNKDIVFDSFNQMRLDHKREFGGVGLGLTIAKHLVTLYNGNINIDSELHKGTDVFIDVSLKTCDVGQNSGSTKVTIDKNLNILIVEDNKLNQMVMRKFLQSIECAGITIVDNGQEALDILQKETYDIILMDLQMPVMDGYEATEIIRSGSLGQSIGKIPIIAVTADATETTKQHVLNIGMNDYMTKPVKKELLLDKIIACTTKTENTLYVAV